MGLLPAGSNLPDRTGHGLVSSSCFPPFSFNGEGVGQSKCVGTFKMLQPGQAKWGAGDKRIERHSERACYLLNGILFDDELQSTLFKRAVTGAVTSSSVVNESTPLLHADPHRPSNGPVHQNSRTAATPSKILLWMDSQAIPQRQQVS
jgi:hypothetical protein